MKVFSRDYIMRIGSTFSEEILLSDIWVALESVETYTVEGGIKLVSDTTVKFPIVGVLFESNTKLTLTMASSVTSTITDLGNYNYAIDIALSGVVQTVMEGSILVKADISKTT